MNEDNNSLYRKMKGVLSVFPDKEIDEKILAMASCELKKNSDNSHVFQWLRPGLAMAFGVVLITVVNVKYYRPREISKLEVIDPPEMVLNYKNIELMADAGKLSEEDWERIGR